MIHQAAAVYLMRVHTGSCAQALRDWAESQGGGEDLGLAGIRVLPRGRLLRLGRSGNQEAQAKSGDILPIDVKVG